jgi:molecular chaperone DnaK
MVADNVSLGQFNLVGIAPAPRGIPQIEVTFDIDSSGILNVSAKDIGTGKEQKMTITASTKLSETDVNKMVNEAEQYEDEDRRRKEEVEVRNTADSLLYTGEKTLADISGKVASEIIDKVRDAITALKVALEGKDNSAIKSKTELLSTALSDAGSALYQQSAQQEQQAQGPQAGYAGGTEEAGGAQPKGDEDVVDADFEVHDEK